MALTLTGFVFDNAGNAIPGATVQGYVTADDQTSGTTAGDPVLTDANGKWAITTSDVDHIPMDVRITYGSSKRWIKAGDKLNLTDLTVSGKLTVGENDTGYDVQLHGATSGRSALWDESEDAFQLNDNTELKFGSLLAGDMVLYHDGSDSYIKNATGALKLATESTGIAVTIGHTTSEVTIGENLTVTGTLSLASIASNWTNAGRTVADMGIATTIDINGGTIDGTVIGGAVTAAITGTAVTGTSLVGGTIAGTTGTFSGVVDITDATEASDATGDTGALRTEGGASIAKKLYVGTDLSVGNDLTVTGDLIINGTTTTVDTTNTAVTDNLLELNSGVTSNANDSGIIIERGSTGDNAILMWDESATGFTVGTTTATAASTGNLANFAAAPFTAAAIVGTTIDAATDFTIGATVITDGVITDASGLSLTAATTVTGALTLGTVAAAGTDTDKFLVLDASGNVDYRTGAEVASDIGVAGTALDDLAAGDAAANLVTTVGNITIDAQATDADVIIKVDDNGSAVTAVTFDGSDSGNAIFVNDVIVNGSVRAATIDYTDGDVAMTIADGGGVTFAQPVALGTPASGIMTNMTGAVTASIVDDAITLDKMAGIARGKIIYGDASGDPAVLAVGTAAQVLTSDGTDIAWANAAGGGTHSFTAAGAISNGELVVLKTNGTVEPIATKVIAFGTQGQFTTQQIGLPDATYDSNANRVVVVYKGASNYIGSYVVGEVDPATNTTSWGATGTFNGGATYMDYPTITFDSNSNKVVIGWRENWNSPGSGRGWAVVGTVDPATNTMTFGTAVQIAPTLGTGNVEYLGVVFDSTSNRVVFSFRDPGTGYIVSVVGAVSGTSITMGTPVVAATANPQNQVKSTFDSNSNRVVLIWADLMSYAYRTMSIVGTVNPATNSITFGSAQVYATSQHYDFRIVSDSTSGSILIAYRLVSGGNYGYLLAGTVNPATNSISFGSAVSFNTATTYDMALAVNSDVGKIGLVYRDYNSGYGYVKVVTLSGTTITQSSATLLTYNATFHSSAATYDPTAGKVVFAYAGLSYAGMSSVFETGGTNLTKWVGISTAAIASGAAGDIGLLGAVAAGQSSLTTGSYYYLTDAATLSTTVVAGREIGRAVSSTEILITQGGVS